MNSIFITLGKTLSTCHSLEASVFAICSNLVAILSLPIGVKVQDTDLNNYLNDAKTEVKKMSFHARIQKLGQLAPKVFNPDFIELLFQAKRIRNEIAHDFMSENSFLLFTPKNRQLLAEKLESHLHLISAADDKFYSVSEQLLVDMQLDPSEYWRQVAQKW